MNTQIQTTIRAVATSLPTAQPESPTLEEAMVLVAADSLLPATREQSLFTDAQARAFIDHYPLNPREDLDFEVNHRTPGWPPVGYSATQVRALDLFRFLRQKASTAAQEAGGKVADLFTQRSLVRMAG